SEFSLRESGIVAWGALPERAGPSALAPIRLGPAEADELLDAHPGTLWNLSAREMDGLRAVRSTAGGAANPARVEAVSARYRALLLQRAQAYRAAGLGGIEPYARRGGAPPQPRRGALAGHGGRAASRRRGARAHRGAPQLSRPPARRAGEPVLLDRAPPAGPDARHPV